MSERFRVKQNETVCLVVCLSVWRSDCNCVNQLDLKPVQHEKTKKAQDILDTLWYFSHSPTISSHCKSIPQYSWLIHVSYDETVLFWWVWSLAGWLRPHPHHTDTHWMGGWGWKWPKPYANHMDFTLTTSQPNWTQVLYLSNEWNCMGIMACVSLFNTRFSGYAAGSGPLSLASRGAATRLLRISLTLMPLLDWLMLEMEAAGFRRSDSDRLSWALESGERVQRIPRRPSGPLEPGSSSVPLNTQDAGSSPSPESECGRDTSACGSWTDVGSRMLSGNVRGFSVGKKRHQDRHPDDSKLIWYFHDVSQMYIQACVHTISDT